MNSLIPFYFTQFEARKPPAPLPHSIGREWLWQIAASATIVLGAWYLHWRWMYSLNPDALWMAYPVVIAETCAWFGMVLYFYNLWAMQDTPQSHCPTKRSEITKDKTNTPIGVDVMIPTYDEDPELVRYTIRDACALRHPASIHVTVYVLDDGDRASMARVAAQEGVKYLRRDGNIGYKAGNLRHGIEHSHGDFLVILDADTRIFPDFLEETMGYFRDPQVAWVQTPQWFYDLPAGLRLDRWLVRRLGWFGRVLARIIGPVRLFKDPFINDPQLFYDVIQRRRNRANASFCCGAGSIHRRTAIMETALRDFVNTINGRVADLTNFTKEKSRHKLADLLRPSIASVTELTPYKFHVSEDFYTSILLHSDTERYWKSIYHPKVCSKMLSPQDLGAWVTQRYKYAGGTLDIFFHDNPLRRTGLSWSRRLFYGMTFFSYLSPLWMLVFIAAPIIALLTGAAPVSAYSVVFFGHLLPFMIMHEIAMILGTWGVATSKSKLLNIAFFSFNLQALWAVLRKQEVTFKVTPKHASDASHLHLVRPQVFVIALTLIAFCVGIARLYVNPQQGDLSIFIVNGFWAGLNAIAMMVLVIAALWPPPKKPKAKTQFAKPQ